jgi:7-carboxy-7-deazaguanine synthase
MAVTESFSPSMLHVVAADAEQRLKITEIFYSLQGESSRVGWPTVFIRLTGCPLRCGYCDTAYAFTGGQWHTVTAILERVRTFATHYVCVTGGEPLAQKNCLPLLRTLCDAGYRVSLETSGALDIGGVDSRVKRIVDIKTPDSGEQHQNRWENLSVLAHTDEVKFVLCSRSDYEWARQCVREYGLHDRCGGVLFSHAHQTLSPTDLADWILHDQLPVRFQTQLHKVLWGSVQGK